MLTTEQVFSVSKREGSSVLSARSRQLEWTLQSQDDLDEIDA
jgi:hypothetical protein